MCVLSRDQDPGWWRKRGERRRRNGIRSLETVSWHHEHYPDTRHWAHEGEHISCVLMFWAVGLFLIMEVSLSLHHQVNRPDLIILILLLSSDQILILSWVVYPVTPGTADNVLLTLAADTLMQCAGINIYISDRYSMSSPVYFPVVSLSLCVITSSATRAQRWSQIVKNGTHQAAGERNQVGPI